MAIERVTLVVSDAGFPAPHASSHAAGGDDELSLSREQISGIGTMAQLDSPVGPYANDTAASAAGVPLGGIYYKSSGQLQIRLS